MPKSKKKSNKETKEKDGDSEKPLPKLVLKVAKEHKKHHKKLEGEGADNTERGGEHSHHKKKKKKHHKHQDRDKDQEKEKEKKSRKREHSVAETTQNEPPVKKLRNKDKEKKADKVDKEIPPFRLCLENLLRNLQRKDVYNIFQFPVSDAVAPGYSKVIKKPMDFMTMSQKIEKDEYTSIEEMKADFLLMCSNAMLYNGPDTIYYKSADKMLSIGLKTLSKEKMHKVSKSLGLAVSDSEDDVVHVEDTDVNVLDSVNTEEESPAPKQRKSERKKKSKEKDREHKNMLESILAASHAARQKLLQKYPDQLYGYISKDKASGNQSFNILNPDATEDTRTREVTLGNVAPPPQAGIPAGQVTKEDKKNRVVPVNYLLYGPFGSFGPSYDSSLSNTTKEESDLLLQTYGSDLGVSYRNSVHEFTNEASCLTGFVDRLLDTITNGAHSKFVKKQKEAEQEEANKENKERTVLKKKAISETQTNTTTTLPTPPTSNANSSQPSASSNVETTPEVDLESLLTLDDLGIDVSFIKDIVGNKEDSKKQTDEKPSDSNVSTKFSAEDVLTKNAELLDSLQKKQNARLSSKYGGTQPIDAEELNIATSLTNNLKEIMKVTKPVDVVPTDAVKRAIGSENYVPEEQKAEAETTPSITENQQQGKTTEAVQAIS